MNKILITMLMIGMSIVASHGTSHAANLVKNSDFNLVKQDMTPSGWVISTARNTEANISLDKTEKKAGSHSLKISVLNPPGQVTLLPERGSLGNVEPGKTYELSLWIKIENLAKNQFQVSPVARLNFRPARALPDPIIDFTTDADIQNKGWQQISLQAVAPEGARDFVMDIIITPGTVWLDDISLRRVD